MESHAETTRENARGGIASIPKPAMRSREEREGDYAAQQPNFASFALNRERPASDPHQNHKIR
ncbi:protein of unknown function [Methanoculleus bourgensis]|uniref:Uncharacterized protein n=1 Tax=Methanoculleus bourgensis TaxID=83986 RepID=A0A0X3BMB8_9EURY|nr:protein of unknown function [Methanoculleus bourgensis]